jgi:hypothetical protein
MKHALCTLPIDGHDDVARPEVSSLSLAPLCYLSGMRSQELMSLRYPHWCLVKDGVEGTLLCCPGNTEAGLNP